MARHTKAYSRFKSRVSEVETLAGAALRRSRQDPVSHAKEINALSRGSIVLLSSHVEGYIREVGELVLEALHQKRVSRGTLSESFFFHISRDLIEDINKSNDPDKVASKVFNFIDTDINHWSKSGPFPSAIPPDRFNRGFSSPSFPKLKKYFGRFGYTSYQLDIERRLAADAQPTINMLNHMVDVRNSIAHGDSSATKTPLEVRSMINGVTTLCRTTDDVFATWCKQKLCAVR
jgi:hypothetical protein